MGWRYRKSPRLKEDAGASGSYDIESIESTRRFLYGCGVL